MDGWVDNFALDTLMLGGVDIGKVLLVDNFDNQPGWVGSEALYVTNFYVGSGSYLDLNGLNLYYINGAIDPGATIIGGTARQVSDCVVDLIDFANFSQYWLETGVGLPADLYVDDDNMVNILDLAEFATNFLGPCPAGWQL